MRLIVTIVLTIERPGEDTVSLGRLVLHDMWPRSTEVIVRSPQVKKLEQASEFFLFLNPSPSPVLPARELSMKSAELRCPDPRLPR
ncbi:hypothetical protein [Microvirga arsenatis]|uniref:DUF982 domain-containing protein n=1 Tax=Microvirga arsenatis TaxID=2692265 RepID=A0ABW9YW55_9HYPH|nr:hypothetical protein [Microvirga arsenatis]NBJ10697.1 hypothetical protein [Microvirga arsenatis]NBJ24405.1 hypothetical protein [Microvirga arsenatis]